MQSLDIEQIRKILPHRSPFLLIDRVTDLVPGVSCTGFKNVTINEEFFRGHFPQRAIMPGVLVVEMMAQTGGVMILSIPEHKGKLAFLGTIDNCKFRKPVVPGDTIRCETKLLRTRGNMGRVGATATVDGAIVAEAEILFALIDDDSGFAGK